MTNNGVTTTDLACAEILWKSADALRGQIDAAEYKHVVLGLLFLKYISDSFETRRGELKRELEADGISGSQIESLLENRDEYTAERVFWVPPEERWTNLQNQAARPDIAKLIDDAILAVERDNTNLKSKLPRDYARRGIAPEEYEGADRPDRRHRLQGRPRQGTRHPWPRLRVLPRQVRAVAACAGAEVVRRRSPDFIGAVLPESLGGVDHEDALTAGGVFLVEHHDAGGDAGAI